MSDIVGFVISGPDSYLPEAVRFLLKHIDAETLAETFGVTVEEVLEKASE